MDSLKSFCSNIQNSILNFIDKIYINLKLYLIGGHLIDDQSINLDERIDQQFALNNFNTILSFCGLNPMKFSSSKIKFWQYFLYATYWFAIGKVIFLLFFLDPIKNYELCVLIGLIEQIMR